MKTKFTVVIFVFILSFQGIPLHDFSDSNITKVILLEIGIPNPDPDYAGSSSAILVNANTYLNIF